jgi:hypothetical protein
LRKSFFERGDGTNVLVQSDAGEAPATPALDHEKAALAERPYAIWSLNRSIKLHFDDRT